MNGSDDLEFRQSIEETFDKHEDLPVPVYDSSPQLPDFYRMSEVAFTDAQQKKLQTPLKDTEIEIDPQGLLYFPQVRYRRRLNDTFGIGAWALRPREMKIEGNTVMFMGELWVEGRFIAWAPGEQEYHPNNPIMSYATALEAAKSDCLTRCCKDLGIATELWDPTFIREWKKKYALEVWTQYVGKETQRLKKGDKKKLWRKKEYDPFEYPWREQTITEKPHRRAQDAPGSTQTKKATTDIKKQDKDLESKNGLSFEQKKSLIRSLILKLVEGDNHSAKAYLKNLTKSNDGKFKGIETVDSISSEKQAGFIIGQIKKEFIKEFGDNAYLSLETIATTNLI